MTAVSEPSRATFSGARGASASSASNSPGLTMIASAPASLGALLRGRREVVPREHDAWPPGRSGRTLTSRPLSSTFIGTTTPPARRIP